MPRLRRSVVAALAGAAFAVWWGMDAATVLYRHEPGLGASPAVPRGPKLPGPAPAVPAAAPLPPRPGRAVTFFGAPSRGKDLAHIARDLIEEQRAALGLSRMPGELRVKREFASLGGHHLRLEQTLGGVPVFLSEVSAHVARDGRPLLVQADVYPVEGAEIVPSVPADAARAAAVEFVAGDEDAAPATETKAPRLMILPEGRRGRLVWRVDVATATESARLFVDAADGEVVRSDSLRVGATGVGAVFDPNPVYVLRDGSLKDGHDGDSAAL